MSVATLRLPPQKFNSTAQMEFAKRLTSQPWHCLPEHRPLGQIKAARRRRYFELSRLRQRMNAASHYEPTGDEAFE